MKCWKRLGEMKRRAIVSQNQQFIPINICCHHEMKRKNMISDKKRHMSTKVLITGLYYQCTQDTISTF